VFYAWITAALYLSHVDVSRSWGTFLTSTPRILQFLDVSELNGDLTSHVATFVKLDTDFLSDGCSQLIMTVCRRNGRMFHYLYASSSTSSSFVSACSSKSRRSLFLSLFHFRCLISFVSAEYHVLCNVMHFCVLVSACLFPSFLQPLIAFRQRNSRVF
jgi:hypothetical protein